MAVTTDHMARGKEESDEREKAFGWIKWNSSMKNKLDYINFASVILLPTPFHLFTHFHWILRRQCWLLTLILTGSSAVIRYILDEYLMNVVLFSINIGVDLYTRSTYTQDNTVVCHQSSSDLANFSTLQHRKYIYFSKSDNARVT